MNYTTLYEITATDAFHWYFLIPVFFLIMISIYMVRTLRDKKATKGSKIFICFVLLLPLFFCIHCGLVCADSIKTYQAYKHGECVTAEGTVEDYDRDDNKYLEFTLGDTGFRINDYQNCLDVVLNNITHNGQQVKITYFEPVTYQGIAKVEVVLP